eukprot:GHVR01113830.1.p1 GENE.GHVR01113830.1~~GHVR01113830.1.p1  ORF type:complete len:113 (-),score=11.09 GHVR01113830.1:891-1229(-)
MLFTVMYYIYLIKDSSIILSFRQVIQNILIILPSIKCLACKLDFVDMLDSADTFDSVDTLHSDTLDTFDTFDWGMLYLDRLDTFDCVDRHLAVWRLSCWDNYCTPDYRDGID